MRKLDLRNYPVMVRKVDGTVDEHPYDVRDVLVDLCFLPPQGCKKVELFKRERLAKKIADAAGETVLLEDAEWQRLSDALDHVGGLGRQEVELVRRIVEAPVIDVVEAEVGEG